MKHSEILRLKTVFGGRVSRIKMSDANARRQSVSADAGSSYTTRLAMKVNGRKCEVWINGELASISVFSEFTLTRFTMNAPDHCGFHSESAGIMRIGVDAFALFTEDGSISEIQHNILDSKQMRRLLALHSFRKGEALHLYRNCVVLYARVEDLTTELIEVMDALAGSLPT